MANGTTPASTSPTQTALLDPTQQVTADIGHDIILGGITLLGTTFQNMLKEMQQSASDT